MKPIYGYVLVFAGAGIGGVLRHGVNLASVRLVGPDLPVSTLAVNVLGSLTIGLIAGYFATRGHATQHLQLFLTTGILGGFTTFSAFSLEAALLWERGQMAGFATFVLGSVLLSIAGVFAGLALMRSWQPM
ncbi:MAG TPA: fluoride efflux transporter CrcB [Gemmatimonadales bacterium]|nr:fluoride efflux transporter CrcB [Gemmatimonadales bacterium]